MAVSTLGVAYVAFGRPYLAMTLNSISSLRRHNPDTPVCLVTNVAKAPPAGFPWKQGIDTWMFVDRPSGENRLVKTSVYDYSPFEKTLFLDCDTVIVGSIASAEFFMDHFDLGLRLTRRIYQKDAGVMLFNNSRPCGDFPTWNGGVVMFRRSAAAETFFRTWRETFERLGYPRDQPSLVEAVFTSGCRVLALDIRWNNSDAAFDGSLLDSRWFRDQTIIWHYKQNIDRVLRRQILEAESGIDGANRRSAGETRHFLGHRRRWIRLGLMSSVVRYFRGRLPDRP